MERRFLMNIKKINELREWMQNNQVEVAYVSNPSSIAYLTGFESDPHERVLALFIHADKAPFLFTPAMEVPEAKKAFSEDVIGYLDTQNPWQIILNELKSRFGQFKKMALEKIN